MTAMDNYRYRVSVIVPVYNVEDYVGDCLESLVNQTIDKTQFEVILVDDGSTDGSLAICREYARIFPFIKLFSRENEGPSRARNFAISQASGKYLMYLDSDDTLTPHTIRNILQFFDSVYDQVDLVTYPIASYKRGVKQKPHFRYKYLKKTGVYDINDSPYITQTNMNICVKNQGVLFNTDLEIQEDQEYICRILADKQMIGYCAEAEYQYNRSDESSITSTRFNAIEVFEKTMRYFEDLFSSFDGEVPRYYQAMYFSDLQWKLKANILYPYHYDEADFAVAKGRIIRLLNQVDDTVIIHHPDVDIFHRAYWLSLKTENHVVPYGTAEDISLLSGQELVYSKKRIELILTRVLLRDNRLKLIMNAKSPIFSFVEKPRIIAVQEKNGIEFEREMDTFASSWNYYKCKEPTNRFWAFYYDTDATDVDSVRFYVEIDGIRYGTSYFFMPACPFNTTNAIYRYAQGNTLVTFDRNAFYLKQITNEERLGIWREDADRLKKVTIQQRKMLDLILDYEKEHEIWLYYDCAGVDKHNGYYQFIHDLKKDDGIDRYYVSGNPLDQRAALFSEEQLKHVITFGGLTHRILFAHAEKIITSYIESNNVNPFPEHEQTLYRHIQHAEVNYLQHGVLHATMPWKYTPERVEVDRVVVSSYFEQENFTKNYGFRKQDLLPSGMPCLELLHRSTEKKNRILFAPSWRYYLIKQAPSGEWLPADSIFLESDYYKETQAFLNNPELIQVLEENDLYLDFKIHPIFMPYLDYFETPSDRIVIADNSVDDNAYAAFMTDFSSYVFNFAYLKCPIVYFVPDLVQFKAGLNLYRQLDLPFEKAFGELTESGDEAVNALRRIIENGMQPQREYQERMGRFFLPIEDSCEMLYHMLRN